MENEEDPVEESAYEHSHSAMEEGEEQEADHLHIKHNKRKYEMNVEIPAVLGGSDNTAALIAAMSNRNNNDGLGGGGALGLVALLALLGRGGIGGFGNDVAVGGGGLQSSVDTNAILQSLGDIKASVPLAEANVQLALAGQAASVNPSQDALSNTDKGLLDNLSGQEKLLLALYDEFINTDDGKQLAAGLSKFARFTQSKIAKENNKS